MYFIYSFLLTWLCIHSLFSCLVSERVYMHLGEQPRLVYWCHFWNMDARFPLSRWTADWWNAEMKYNMAVAKQRWGEEWEGRGGNRRKIWTVGNGVWCVTVSVWIYEYFLSIPYIWPGFTGQLTFMWFHRFDFSFICHFFSMPLLRFPYLFQFNNSSLGL